MERYFKGHALKLNSLTLCKSATTNLAPSRMKTGIGQWRFKYFIYYECYQSFNKCEISSGFNVCLKCVNLPCMKPDFLSVFVLKRFVTCGGGMFLSP